MTQTSRSGFIRTDEQAEIDAQTLRFRSLGWTYRQVAEQMGCDTSTAQRRCLRALASIPAEAVHEYRALELERLDALLTVAMEKALDPNNKSALFAMDRALAIADRRAKLLGLDAPIRSQVETVTYDGNSIETEVAKLRHILEAHGSEPVLMDGQTGEAGAITD